MNTQAPIRTAAVAGQFYPESPDVLREEVDALLAAAPKDDRITGDIVAIVAPHAGYIYSGRIAAIAYRQVQGREYDAVVILAPSHREAFAGVSLMPAGGYETPLGIAGIHEGIARKLLEQGGCIH
ncbi:MAG TPA: AmmeMemoRadiSam system protein B, partial [Candidatus Latescibacteria bacterium]|nr:AmmeMemoRadiSam system protein B [Candidatus Latescibacterota bacterium]